MIERFVPLVLLALCACTDGKDSPVDDTDPDTDTDPQDDSGEEIDCEGINLAESAPIDGAANWYYRDPITLTFSADASGVAVITATDGNDADVALTQTFDESGFNAELLPSSGTWAASTAYTINVEICDTNVQTGFTTDAYGEPLAFDPAQLVDQTYFIDLAAARYSEPAGVGSILRLYLTDPILLGVTAATATEIELIGAQGFINGTTGDVVQRNVERFPIWDFGAADFTEQPYFQASSSETVFSFSGEDIPVYDFELQGTFSADGLNIGGATFRGLGDTRNLGSVIGVGDEPGAACEFLGKLTIECEPCPDDGVYCLTLAGEVNDPYLIKGMTLNQGKPE